MTTAPEVVAPIEELASSSSSSHFPCLPCRRKNKGQPVSPSFAAPLWQGAPVAANTQNATARRPTAAQPVSPVSPV
jgi:hypothetical protein